MKLTALLICFLLTIAANSFTAAEAQVDVKDSLALVDLYNSTDGKHWVHHTYWLSKKPVSMWYGITVRENRVTTIKLVDNQLKGIIPFSIGDIIKLDTLKLYSNVLSGTIPSSIGNLVNLTYLHLAFNRLTGSIPGSIGNLIKLTELSLAYNQLSGTIPSSIGNLVNLTGLSLTSNLLQGAIPPTIGNLASIGSLDLDYNQLSGDVPLSLKMLNTLRYFSLRHNQLSQSKNIYFLAGPDKYISGDIGENNFTFNGLEYVAKKIHLTFYAPQAIIHLHHRNNYIAVNAGGTLSNNTYYWYQVGKDSYTTIKGDSIFHPTHSGRYYAEVTNAIAGNLKLLTDTVTYITLRQKDNIASQNISIHLSIYPNPATNIIHIQANGTATIVLTNSYGKVLLTKNINTTGEINTSQFASGTYYIQNKTTGEREKIVVVH